MSLVSETTDARPLRSDLALAEPSMAGAGDYFQLMKPRVMSLVVFTALVGMIVAPVHVNPVIGFFALVCIAVGAGAAGALNMWYDADIDAKMTRTANRPIPRGRVKKGDVHKAVVVRTAKDIKRADGSVIRFDTNAAVLAIAQAGPSGAWRVALGPAAWARWPAAPRLWATSPWPSGSAARRRRCWA